MSELLVASSNQTSKMLAAGSSTHRPVDGGRTRRWPVDGDRLQGQIRPPVLRVHEHVSDAGSIQALVGTPCRCDLQRDDLGRHPGLRDATELGAVVRAGARAPPAWLNADRQVHNRRAAGSVGPELHHMWTAAAAERVAADTLCKRAKEAACWLEPGWLEGRYTARNHVLVATQWLHATHKAQRVSTM